MVPACGLAGKPWQRIKMGQKWFCLHCELSGSGDFGNSSRPQTGLDPTSIPKKRSLSSPHPYPSQVLLCLIRKLMKQQDLPQVPVSPETTCAQPPAATLTPPDESTGAWGATSATILIRWQPGPSYMPFRPTLLSEHLGSTSEKQSNQESLNSISDINTELTYINIYPHVLWGK